MPNAASRLITLVLLLQRQPNQKAGDLAKQLGVSVRSLHRYVGMLDGMGIPVYSERGRHGGFSLVRGYRMPPLVFTPEEAVAVSLGTGLVGEMWGRLYREAAGAALAKLENLLPEPQRQEMAWARRSLVAGGLQRADPSALAPTLETLRQAVRELRRVEMTYQSAGRPTAETRRLDPYALAYRSGWWYVIGYCGLRQEVRTFCVDRIRELSLSEEVFQLPPDFNAGEYLDREFQGQPQLRVRMCFAAEAARAALANRACWEALEEEPDGTVVVTMSSPDLNWAASSALMYGPLVEVIDPPELRRLVRDWAQATANLYFRGDSASSGAQSPIERK